MSEDATSENISPESEPQQTTSDSNEQTPQPAPDASAPTEAVEAKDSPAESEKAVEEQRLSDEKSDAAWRRQRRRIQRQNQEITELKKQLQTADVAPNVPGQQGVQTGYPTQQNGSSVLYDPVTGRQIDLNVSYDELVGMSQPNQSQPNVPQPAPRRPISQVAAQPKPTGVYSDAMITQANACLRHLDLKGIKDMEAKFKAVQEFGGLNNTMVNAAAVAAEHLGENGFDLLYDLAKMPEGRRILSEIADYENEQSQTIAMSHQIQRMVAAKQHRLKSTAPKIPSPIADAGGQTKRWSTAAEHVGHLHDEGTGEE